MVGHLDHQRPGQAAFTLAPEDTALGRGLDVGGQHQTAAGVFAPQDHRAVVGIAGTTVIERPQCFGPTGPALTGQSPTRPG